MTTQPLTLSRWLWAHIRFKPFSALLSIFLLVTGLSLVLTVSYLREQVDNSFTRDMQGIDLVVSSKGSPLQIVLSSVFHLDTPTGNIPLAAVQQFEKHMMVKKVIPVSLGDNYEGYRIIGTRPDYIQHYRADFAAGTMFAAPMEAVVGSLVAQRQSLHPGKKIYGAHGLAGSGDMHADHPYTVVGILNPTGTVLDRLVLTPLESVWDVHGHAHHDIDDDTHDHQHEHGHEHHEDHAKHEENTPDHLEVTALLLTYKSPLATVQMPRWVNSETDFQAASPVFEMMRLNKLLGTGETLLKYLGFVLLLFALSSLLIASFFTVRERYYDIALLRAAGASRQRVFWYIMAEVFLIAAAGVFFSGFLTYVLVACSAEWLMQSRNILIEVDIALLDIRLMVTVFMLAVLAGVFAAFKAYRLNVIQVLTRGV